MIGYFPPLYQDETLHSAMGRLNDRVPPPSSKAALRETYQRTTITAVVDLPGELITLANSIPSTMGVTPETLLLEHTLWPLFAAYQGTEKRNDSKKELLSGGHPYLSLGLMSSKCPFSRWLRYCPECVLADRYRVRETYWHRTHQIPGVMVCPVHGIRLENSNVPLRHLRNRHKFISAESAIGDIFGEFKRGTDLEISIAKSAAWVLAHPEFHCTHEEFRPWILSRLVELGYATHNGRIRDRKLQEDFEKQYPESFLSEAGCKTERIGTWWVLRVTRKPRGYQHPLRYVLLLHFLGATPKQFFESISLPHPFGRAPWPCLNRLSDHCGALTITDCEVRPSWNSHRLVGFFTCQLCGMRYKRNGPDKKLNDRLHRDHIPQYGSVWDRAFSGLWGDRQLSIRRIAAESGVDINTAIKQAVRLGLSLDRCKNDSQNRLQLASRSDSDKSSDIDRLKLGWQQLRAGNPEATKTQLRIIAPSLYAQLYRRDKSWLDENSPPKYAGPRQYEKVDWDARDAQIASDVTASAATLRARTPTVRLSRTALLREAGWSWVRPKYLPRLDRTRRVLGIFEENSIAFAIRRIEGAVLGFDSTKQPLREWRLVRVAGLRAETATIPAVKDAIQKALSSLAHTGA